MWDWRTLNECFPITPARYGRPDEALGMVDVATRLSWMSLVEGKKCTWLGGKAGPELEGRLGAARRMQHHIHLGHVRVHLHTADWGSGGGSVHFKTPGHGSIVPSEASLGREGRQGTGKS